MNFEWSKLRSWCNSQNKAFEELVCQLAAGYDVPIGSRFERLDLQDGGTEGYWTLPDGSIWGFQAKFITDRSSKDLFPQLNVSVNSALEKRPHLCRYTICLPFNTHDPGQTNKDNFHKRWEQAVKTWANKATSLGMSVSFDRWGEFEIMKMLAEKKHEGRYRFWFDKEIFDSTWFARRFERTQSNLPSHLKHGLDIRTDINEILEAAVMDLATKNHLSEMSEDLCRNVGQARVRYNPPAEISGVFEALKVEVLQLDSLIKDLSPVSSLHGIAKQIDSVREALTNYRDSLVPENVDKEETSQRDKFSYERHFLDLADSQRRAIHSFLKHSPGLACRHPVLIVEGAAGSGKTHVVSNFVRTRISQDRPAILLLGRDFGKNANLWTQIFDQIQIKFQDEDEFLGALDSCAESLGERALIAIDAINESDDPRIWVNQLAGLLKAIERYRHVAVVLTVRDSFFDYCIPKDCPAQSYLHQGFSGHEDEAISLFMGEYKIELTQPLLNPEFANPLFLLLLCEGLKNEGLHRIPTGLNGISKIFDFYLNSIDRILSQSDRLDYEPSKRLVRKSVSEIISKMHESTQSHLPQSDAESLLQSIYPSNGFSKGLLRALLNEGVLIADAPANGNDEVKIRFAYQRLHDFLYAHYLIEKNVDAKAPLKCFEEGSSLSWLIKDEYAAMRNAGLLEMLCLILPEIFGVEVTEATSQLNDTHAMKLAFINSMLWRQFKPDEILSVHAIDFINEHLLSDDSYSQQFLDALIALAAIPNHPLNADSLHDHLIEMKLFDRDLWWSNLIDMSFEDNGAVRRLIDWSSKRKHTFRLEPDTAILVGKTLAWFLSSPNRILRDKATKSLVMVLTDRLQIATLLVQRFHTCNDLYVTQRLLAAISGAVFHSESMVGLDQLGTVLESLYLSTKTPPTCVLTRDSIHSILYQAKKRGLQVRRGYRARIQYKSPRIQRIPSRAELKKKHGYGTASQYTSLWSELCEGGDFLTFLGSQFSAWSNIPLNTTKKQYFKKRIERLEGGLSRTQLAELKRWRTKSRSLSLFGHYTDSETKKLKRVLGKKTAAILKLEYFRSSKFDHGQDTSSLYRWIFARVQDLGWKPLNERMQSFGYYRTRPTRERLVAKYAWIASFELLAMLSDRFQLKSDSFRKLGNYLGPWQINARDLDPSLLPASTVVGISWWRPDYHFQVDDGDDNAWINDLSDLPSPSDLLSAVGADKAEWFNLCAHYSWEEGKVRNPADYFDDENKKSRRLWLHIESYLVPIDQMKTICSWLVDQDMMGGHWLPDPPSTNDVFLSEIPGGTAFLQQEDEYFNYNGWFRPTSKNMTAPCEMYLTAQKYKWSSDDDKSFVDGAKIDFFLPQRALLEAIDSPDLRVPGQVKDRHGDLHFLDPSFNTAHEGALLARQDLIQQYLKKLNFGLVWIITGEKWIVDDNSHAVPRKRRPRFWINSAFYLGESGIQGVFFGRPFEGNKE